MIFLTLMYGLLVVMGLACAIPSWLSRKWAMYPIKGYCNAVIWMLRVIVGTKLEVRGDVPNEGCIVASKHQAFLDIILLTAILPQPSFVMKKSIKYIPVLNIYAERLGCIPIDRSAGASAMKLILAEAERTKSYGRQVILFPQGTRTLPNQERPYKFGVVRLYRQLERPIVLTALNSGWFWSKSGIRRNAGTTVVEFLGQIPPGRTSDGLLDEIRDRIEAGSDALAEEAYQQLTHA
ncbi:MAG: lysophospholipid acyltransferase family protein [Pseudomonadota bacterium]